MEFTLSDETKRLMLTKHLEQIRIEAYQHEMNRLVAVEIGDKLKETEAVAAITVLETESNVYVAEIAFLDDPLANSGSVEISDSNLLTENTKSSVNALIIGAQDAVGTQASYVFQVDEVVEI